MILCNEDIIHIIAVTQNEAEAKTDVDELVGMFILSVLLESFSLSLRIPVLSIVVHEFMCSSPLVIYSVVVDSVVVISVVVASVVVASVTALSAVVVFIHYNKH